VACHRPMTVADLASHLMHSPMTGPAGSLCGNSWHGVYLSATDLEAA